MIIISGTEAQIQTGNHRNDIIVTVKQPDIQPLIHTILRFFGLETILNQIDTEDIRAYLKELDDE